MLMSAVQKPVRRELERVQAHLRELFHTPIPILNQVGGHVLATRGKKFRPTLLLLTARLKGHLGSAPKEATRYKREPCSAPAGRLRDLMKEHQATHGAPPSGNK